MRTAIVALLVALVLSPAAPGLPSPAFAAPSESAGAEDIVPVNVARVLLVNEAPAVLLLDKAEQHYLLMYIDLFMANAIRMGMDEPVLERPLTHDLIGILLRRLGAEVNKVTITALKDNTYYALISLQVNGSEELIDSRPSDALAIAVRQSAPIYARSDLLTPVEQSPPAEEEVPAVPEPEAPAEPEPPRVKT